MILRVLVAILLFCAYCYADEVSSELQNELNAELKAELNTGGLDAELHDNGFRYFSSTSLSKTRSRNQIAFENRHFLDDKWFMITNELTNRFKDNDTDTDIGAVYIDIPFAVFSYFINEMNGNQFDFTILTSGKDSVYVSGVDFNFRPINSLGLGFYLNETDDSQKYGFILNVFPSRNHTFKFSFGDDNSSLNASFELEMRF